MRKIALLLSIFLSSLTSLTSAAEVTPKVSPKVEAFEYGEVKLLPGEFKNRFDTNRKYLLSIPSESLLYPFYKESAIKVRAGSRPLGGWEAMSVDVRGHFMGHFLSACARTYATSGDLEIKTKADEIVAELAKCQRSNGNGYVGSISEKILTALENGREAEVWAPYYVHHKTLMGLYEMYKYAGNSQALEVAKGLADYIKGRMDKLSDERVARILEVEYGGMSEALYDMYSATGEEKYRDLGRRFEQGRFLDPLAQGRDNLTRLHANTNIPKVYGAARAYELTGDARYRDIAVNFWDMVTRTRSYATGGSNVRELWDRPNQLSETLGEANQETCTTYNMLWLTRFLTQWTGEAKYGDYYERNLVNGILSAQRPADGQFCYFTPMKSGAIKEFGTPLDTFWCCYGTGVQAFSDFASSIYFRDAQNLYVNLFIPSDVTWKKADGAVRVMQETAFPQKSSTRLTIKSAGGGVFALKVRVPWWAKKGVEVKINQAKTDVAAAPGSFMTIQRKWKDLDVVDISMPMSLYAEPINDDPNLIAVMYGPMVMAGLVFNDTAFKGDKNAVASWLETAPGTELAIGDRIPKTADSLPDEISHPSYEAGLRRERLALTFKTKSPNLPVQFVPLYQVTSQPYGIYFRVTE